MSKHTPGPWTFEVHGGQLQIWSQNTWIANVNQDHAGRDVRDDANARLLAAAPELLGMLKHARHRLEKIESTFPELHSRETVKRINQLIYKITGDSHE